MKRDRNTFETTVELEHGSSTREYVITFRVTPYMPAKTYGPPENCYPSEGGDVEDVEAWFERVKRCPAHRFGKPSSTCRECKVVRERRPELDDLLSEDDLLDCAGVMADGAREDAEESRAEARREAREDR